MQEHKEKRFPGFATKYGLAQLVYFEQHVIWTEARVREMRIKHWKRLWKLKIIEVQNVEWRDLTDELSNLITS